MKSSVISRKNKNAHCRLLFGLERRDFPFKGNASAVHTLHLSVSSLNLEHAPLKEPLPALVTFGKSHRNLSIKTYLFLQTLICDNINII